MQLLALADGTDWFIPTIILAYLSALIVYGAWHSRRIKTQADFAVAGRSLTAPVLVGTMLATWIGTGSLISNAQKTYEIGVAMLLVPLGGAVGLLILSQVAARIRRFEQLTVQDILEQRFGVVSRIFATAAIITAYLIIVSYQYRAGGAVIHTIYPEFAAWCNEHFAGLNSFLREHTRWTDGSWGSVLAAVFIIGYTVLGGLVSVAYTDVINGIVMILGIAIGIPVLLGKAGGFAGIAETFADDPSKLTFFGPIGPVKAVNYILPAMLLVMGEANLYQRFFAARSMNTARRAGLILVFAVLAVELAIIFFAFLGSAVETGLVKDQHGYVILMAAKNHFPSILAAVVLSAAVAIIVSTADSFLLVSSNSVVRDIYHRFVNSKADEKTLVRVSRTTVVLLGLIAFVASVASKKFFEVSMWAYTVYGASITPALLATFFWRRATAAGAAAGIAGGTLTTIFWGILNMNKALPAALGQFDEVLPAMIVSIALLVGVSLATPPPRREQWEPFAAH